MPVTQAFGPSYNTGQVITAGASAQVSLETNTTAVCVTNAGANIAYVRVGNGTFSATTADMPVLPNARVVLTKGMGQDKMATYSAAGTTLHVITGEGLI